MPTRQEIRDETHARVAAAAARLFLDRGYRATTVRDVASAAEVSVGTVMTVGDKETLLVATVDAMIADLQDHAPTPAPPRGGGPQPDVVDAVLALLDPFLELFSTDVDLAREYGGVLMTGRHGAGVFGRLGPELVEQIRAVLAGADAGPRDPAAAAQTIYLAYLGTLFAWAGRGTADSAWARAALHDVITFAAHGHVDRGADA